MGGPGSFEWDTQASIIAGIVPTALEYDRDGITLIPIFTPSGLDKLKPNATQKDNIRTEHDAMTYLGQYATNLKSSTPTRTCFKRHVEAHVQKCTKSPNDTKRLNAILIFDGLPSDTDTQSMTRTIEWAIMELHSKGLDPKKYMGLTYVVVTEELPIMAGFRKLDQRIVWGGEKNIECDFTNAIYPFSIQALGGAKNKVVVQIILTSNNSEACDEAVEHLQTGTSKDIMDIIDAFIEGGFANEV
ncbi:hypothetical protein Daus18300_007376 [Diaporthe australafricana]|uniref:Uncharacterized protein n=1 Tax=Diaporthe australafricana TaxID=127596 RepID=A0ABR3WN08_9PEZI